MEWIKTFLVHIYAILAVIPFLSFIGLWLVFAAVFKDKKRATTLSMDITMVFLLGAVPVMYNEIFNSRFGFWLIVLYFLIGAGLLGNFQNRMKGRIDAKKIFRTIWRFGFLLLSLFYILFLFVGILKFVTEV